MRVEKYRTPPKRAFRAMGLGVMDANGYIKVVAGFRFKWWDYLEPVEPIFVNARVLRLKKVQH